MSRRRLTLQSQTLGTKPADFLSKPGCAPKDPNSRELSRFLWLISAALSRLSLEPRGAQPSVPVACVSHLPSAPRDFTSRREPHSARKEDSGERGLAVFPLRVDAGRAALRSGPETGRAWGRESRVTGALPGGAGRGVWCVAAV